MSNDAEDFIFEYLNNPASDAKEQLAEAWDLIIELIMEDYENEARSSA